MTTPQPLPPDPEAQQQPADSSAEAAAVATIAALLAAASAAGATYMAGQVAQAGVVNALRGLGLSRKQAGKLVELDAARPSPPVIPLQPSTRQVFRDGPTYRAQYLVNAAKRIVTGVGEKPLGDLVDTERRYFNQHRTAQVQREQAAARIDAAANSYGQLLGWHAVLDDRTTAECRAADGRNFYADRPPAIGLPGLKHAGNCRCYPGPPHEGAPLVDPSTAPPSDVAASSTREAVELSAKTAAYSTTHVPLGRPGGPGLWGHKNWQLPAYIQNVAHGIIRTGVPRSRAIEIAVGKVRDWAEGKGNVSPEVRAASVKAIAEWEALRARAKATKLAAEPAQEIEMAVKPGQRYRHGWIPIAPGAGGAKGAPKLPSGKNHASRLAVLPDAKSRRAHAATLSEADLHATDQELTRRAALLGKPGQVASHHKVVKDEIARRKAKTPGKSTDPAVVKAKLAEIDAKKKSGQMTSTVHAQQRMKLLKELGGAERASNASKRRVRLASDNDGVELAMFGGKKPTPKDVRDMVHAHSRVPDQLKEKYRAKVIGHARNANALHHIPPAWLKGKTSKPGGKGKPFGGKQAAPFGSK